ncbi:somatostatin receptor-like protein [Euroglyphus maynei]|uniref:Somatostatin receptor-like protein n=1 Tax=Euroglyphus maynei TaxID=6958 RepID=A0A1Y3AUG7_EURMA|nr:somatostatin receptor-like protein [Euroglyphus maynei]
MSTFGNLFPNNSDLNNWNNIASNLFNRTATTIGHGIKFGGNESDSLPFDQTPTEIRQYLLIFRLVLLGIGTFDTILLLAIYIKCTGIINNCLGVYVANISIAALIDMIDAAIWSINEFGYKIEDYNLPWWVEKMSKLPQFGLPTVSLFFLLLIIDRFFATCFSNCHKGCYGWKLNAVFIIILIWLGSFFMTFILVFKDMLFAHDKLYELLRFLISYIGPFAIKLLLLLILFAKRKVVPDSEQSQAFIQRQRESLYYVMTIIALHLLFSAPYYATQINNYFHLVQIRIDQWIIWLLYALSELPLMLNPIFVLSIDPDFRDSLIFVCTCSSRNRRDMIDLCDDHAESQPLAPMATSPVAEEKEHLDEAES